MKVLLTLDFPPAIGGIQRYLCSIVEHTFSAGDVIIAGCKGARNASTKNQVTYISPPPFFPKLVLLSILITYWRLVRNSRVETQCGNVYAALIPWLVRRPYSVYAYGTELLGLDSFGVKSALFRSVLQRAREIMVLGAHTQSLLERAGIRSPIRHVPPRLTCDNAAITRRVEQKLSAEPDPIPLILSVGRLVPHKGHHILLKALSELSDALPWRAVIVGDGPNFSRLSMMRAQCRTGDRITLDNNANDGVVRSLYHEATVFVLPSLSTSTGTEGFGIVVLEAMSYGAAIIASKTGGIPEVVGDCGLLVEPGDWRSLAKSIRWMLNSRELRTHYARMALDRLVTHYVW